MLTPSGRAAPLPLKERKAAIIEATLPLVEQHGVNVTTKQIAEAAGVAEGTIFRIFATKTDLLQAVAETIFDTSRGEAVLRAIDPSLPLEEKLVMVVSGMRCGILKAHRLMEALGHNWMAEHMGHRTKQNVHAKVYGKLVADLARPHQAELRIPVENLHSLIFSAVFATLRPDLYGGSPPEAKQLVSLLLDGARIHSGTKPL